MPVCIFFIFQALACFQSSCHLAQHLYEPHYNIAAGLEKVSLLLSRYISYQEGIAGRGEVGGGGGGAIIVTSSLVFFILFYRSATCRIATSQCRSRSMPFPNTSTPKNS